MLNRPMRAGIRLLGAVLLVAGCQSQTPSASPSPSASAASVEPSASESATGTPTFTPWSQTGSFNKPGGFSVVNGLAHGNAGVVAVGTQYDAPLPNLGPPPPHEGRVWLSSDGLQWQDVTLSGVFGNVSLNHVVAAPNGSFVVFGFGPDTRAWSSPDGQAWTEFASPFPAGAFVFDAAAGDQGYLAQVQVTFQELWFSSNATAWTQTHAFTDETVAIGAGDQGFVAGGAHYPGGVPGTPYAIASSDGSTWITASGPPAPPLGARAVAPVAGDWYALPSGQTTSGFDSSAATWFSVDGLQWSAIGSMPLNAVPAGPTTCHEYVRALHGSTPWLIANTALSGPCSEGGFIVHGTQRSSQDGVTWMDLPFPAGTVGNTGSGSSVNATIVVNGLLILAGQSNSSATFWVGE
jgi:hypothetical protein